MTPSTGPRILSISTKTTPSPWGVGRESAVLGKARRRCVAGSDTNPHLLPAGTIGAAADNAGFAIYLPGVASLSGADDSALPELSRKVRGVRCLGSVALELCEVAAGRADLFVTMRSSPWDHNAARIILEEAGGAIFTVAGDELPLEQKSTVLALNAIDLKDRVLYV